MRKQTITIALAALLAGCTVQRPPAVELPIDDSQPTLDQAQVEPPPEVLHHKTITTVRDITDPEHPFEVAKWEGNLLGSCGVRALMQLAIGGNGSSMGAATGASDTLGQVCAGTNQHSVQKTACAFDDQTRIFIGAAAASECTGSATPFPCCTGSGTGCTISYKDVLTFAEGQPNQSLTGIATAWETIFATPAPTKVTGLFVDSAPTLYWNGTTLEGIRFLATATGSVANHKWCEYSVRGNMGITGGPLPCGPMSTASAGISPGWQLNHALFPSCTTKTSGSIWQIEVRVMLS